MGHRLPLPPRPTRPLRYADPADEADMARGSLVCSAEDYAAVIRRLGLSDVSRVRLEPEPDDPIIDELMGRPCRTAPPAPDPPAPREAGGGGAPTAGNVLARYSQALSRVGLTVRQTAPVRR